MKSLKEKLKGNMQECLPFENEAKRFYKLKNEDFNKLIKV